MSDVSLEPGEIAARASESMRALWERAMGIWISGGPGMIAIAIDAFVMFALGMHLRRRFRRKAFQSVPERIWRRWVEVPGERNGTIGALIDAVIGSRSLAESATIFQGVRVGEIAPFERDLRVMRVCIGAAPLLGLFGTVSGMLTTFGALARGGGGDQTMSAIARGISEALITTETGLVVALPGLFFQYSLARSLDRYRAFLAHFETVCTQQLFRRLRNETRAA